MDVTPTCDTCGAIDEEVVWCGECGSCLIHCTCNSITISVANIDGNYIDDDRCKFDYSKQLLGGATYCKFHEAYHYGV